MYPAQRRGCPELRYNLLEAVKACGESGVNWTKTQECRQWLEEHLSDFGDDHGGIYQNTED